MEAEDRIECFATAARGTEEPLLRELRELRIHESKQATSGVRFRGNWADAWRVCLWSRIAQRVHVVLARFEAPDQAALYDGIRAVEWSPFLTPRHTFAVGAFCRSPSLTHSGFVALKAKDAIVDQLRDRQGSRPDVARDDPDVRVFVHVLGTRATAYLDLAGTPLHMRGYRCEHGEAPLRETLAAAMLKLARWDCRQPLLDPMCGSGTIAIEAALMAGNVAPGMLRKRFGFERWACHDATAEQRMAGMRAEARSLAHSQLPRIIASDCDADVLSSARTNARTARVRFAFRQTDVLDLRIDRPSLVVTNPPYGRRLEVSAGFYQKLGGAISRWHGSQVCVLAGTPDLLKAIPLNPHAQWPLFNGDIPCRVLLYDVP